MTTGLLFLFDILQDFLFPLILLFKEEDVIKHILSLTMATFLFLTFSEQYNNEINNFKKEKEKQEDSLKKTRNPQDKIIIEENIVFCEKVIVDYTKNKYTMYFAASLTFSAAIGLALMRFFGGTNS